MLYLPFACCRHSARSSTSLPPTTFASQILPALITPQSPLPGTIPLTGVKVQFQAPDAFPQVGFLELSSAELDKGASVKLISFHRSALSSLCGASMDPGSVLLAWSAEAILKSDLFYVQIFALSLLHAPFPHVRAPLFSRVLLAEGKGQGRKQEVIPVSVTCSPGLAPSYQQSVRQGYQGPDPYPLPLSHL